MRGTEGTLSPQEQLLRTVIRAAGTFKSELRRFLRDGEVTPDEWLLLDTVWTQRAWTQQQLAESTGKDKSTVVRLVDSLERKQLISRRKERTRRALELTRRGEALCEETAASLARHLEFVAGGVDAARAKAMVTVLERMAMLARSD